MSASLRRHQEISLELARQFANYLKGRPCRVYIAPFDVRILESSESDSEVKNVVQPDLSVICDGNKLDKRGCKDAPDLVIEVISPSTLKKDLLIKKALYEKAVVGEYYPSEMAVLAILLMRRARMGELNLKEKKVPSKLVFLTIFQLI